MLRNKSGGIVEQLNPEETLAKLATLGILGSRTRSTTSIDEVFFAANQCQPEFVAKTAIYSKVYAKMKDMPVVLLCNLLVRNEPELFNLVAPYVLDNLGFVKKFVELIRSKQMKVKSLGSSAKKYIQGFLKDSSPVGLHLADYGTPTLKDIISLTHTKPTPEHEDYFAWIMGGRVVPEFLKDYKEFTSGRLTERLPKFTSTQRLLNFWDKLSDSQKTQLMAKMTWSQIRTNLTRISLHDKQLAESRLMDPDAGIIYKDLDSLITTYNNLQEDQKDIFEKALVNSIKASPKLNPTMKIQMYIDISGSMRQHLLKAGWLARYLATPNSEIKFFNTQIDSGLSYQELMTQPLRDSIPCRGGTTVSSALLDIDQDTEVAIIISDNETWGERNTSVAKIYRELRDSKKLNAKVIFWDLEYKNTAPVIDRQSLNLSGLSNQLIHFITNFIESDKSLVDSINEIEVR